jgi:imidazolonepropionase-like amidohydrolase
MRSGVRAVVGSGGEPKRTRFAAMNAQLASSHVAASPEDEPLQWLRWLTVEAAEVLGLEHRGRLRKGAHADLVIWSGDPGHPATRVDQVMIAGEMAYPSAFN